MHADELRTAVTQVVNLLNHAGVRGAIDKYRTTKGEQRTAAAARLSHAGAVLVEKFETMTPAERHVIQCLHLETLGSAQYWQELMAPDVDPKTHQADMVRLASRVMFSGNHLPAIISLLADVKTPTQVVPPAALGNPLLLPVSDGEGALFIRLTDAGEKASDPDRIARAIDGVDMLYSACASIARRPAIDLRLDSMAAKHNRDRDFRFTGDRDSISAVFAVVDSIPGALAEIDPDQDIDLDSVVRSLPIFNDLNTLASLGTFSGKDLKDISETMHQGAVLTLESGVILVDEHMVAQGVAMGSDDVTDSATATLATQQGATAETPAHAATTSAAEDDEHYNRYLREREAMMRPPAPAGGNAVNGHSDAGLSGVFARAESGTDDQTRRDAVDDLLKSLGQSRTS